MTRDMGRSGEDERGLERNERNEGKDRRERQLKVMEDDEKRKDAGLTACVLFLFNNIVMSKKLILSKIRISLK